MFFKNALFVHRDINGVCAYEKHNIAKNKNLNIQSTGTQKAWWYSDDIGHDGVDAIFIGEAAIDALSFATLSEKSSPNIALMTFGGQMPRCYTLDKITGVYTFDNDHPFLQTLFSLLTKSKASTILLGNDNDEVGRKYDDIIAQYVEANFSGKFDLYLNKAPHNLNDWNDYLCAERFNQRVNYAGLAQNTRKLVFVEAGVGKFKIMPSTEAEGVTYIALPPAGHLSSKMAAVAKSFVHVMNENPHESSVAYTLSDGGDFQYVKGIEMWRREFCPNQAIEKNKTTTLRSLMENGLVNVSENILKDWGGYTEAIHYPHKLAQNLDKILISQSHDDSIHYYHSNSDPVKLVVAVPLDYEESHEYEIKDLLVEAFNFDQSFEIGYPPILNGSRLLNGHAELFKKCLEKIQTLKYLDSSVKKLAANTVLTPYRPIRAEDGILNKLASKELLHCRNVDQFKTLKKKIPLLSPDHKHAVQPLGT